MNISSAITPICRPEGQEEPTIMLRFGSRIAALTAVHIAVLLLAACAGGTPDPTTLGEAPATRALIERTLAEREARTRPSAFTNRAEAGRINRFAENAEKARIAGNFDEAAALAERAIAADPRAAGARLTLAQAYFSGGRFRSARQAYADLIALAPQDPELKIGAAIAALALGDTADARSLLAAAGPISARVADIGLAEVLLGDISQGLATLEGAVRSGASTARTRQNLALAMALAGRWNDARATAAIDLPPQQVEKRVAAWAALAVSDDSAWRTVTLLGISPQTVDPGRPLELAYAPEDTRFAAASPEDRPLAAVEAVVTSAELPVPAPAPEPRETNSAPDTFVRTGEAAPLRPRRSQAASKPSRARAQNGTAARIALPTAAQAGEWLVQLGSYMNAEDARSNWQVLKSRSAFLADYTAMRSRTHIDGTTYYRLSVGRFDSVSDAQTLCRAVKAAGDGCFVRAGKFNS